jgi:quercetin dioxygenase-like cupin family protein
MAPSIARFRWDDIPLDKVTEMVARKRVEGATIELTQAYFKKGARVPLHAHAGEQLFYVLQGVVHVTSGADIFTLREGDLIVVPPDVPHDAEVFDDAFVMTVGTRA